MGWHRIARMAVFKPNRPLPNGDNIIDSKLLDRHSPVPGAVAVVETALVVRSDLICASDPRC